MYTKMLHSLVREFPERMHKRQMADVPRVNFHLTLALADRRPADLTVCDVGGGLGLFVAACAALGSKTFLVDDFNDPSHGAVRQPVSEFYKSLGVQIVERDVIENGFGLNTSIDVATLFGTLEHFHRSPKRLLHEIADALLPDGILVIGTPNCHNLRKRIAWPLGRGCWSQMRDWYETPVFRGHVREPSVADLRYIARDLGLKAIRVHGRNWVGHHSPKAFTRFATRMIDIPLRCLPSLCGNIYVTGVKHEVPPGIHESPKG